MFSPFLRLKQTASAVQLLFQGSLLDAAALDECEKGVSQQTLMGRRLPLRLQLDFADELDRKSVV